LTLLVACGTILFAGYQFYQLLEAWTAYDAKESAIESVARCFDATSEEQDSVCGLLLFSPCLDGIQQAMERSNNQIAIEVLWYNWEDNIPNRGGDEVYLEVTFSDEHIFRILWYEGTLEECQSGA
jgi:hypothetical protein